MTAVRCWIRVYLVVSASLQGSRAEMQREKWGEGKDDLVVMI